MTQRNSGNDDATEFWTTGLTCWPIGVLAASLSIWCSMEGHVYVPYLYTRVQCCDQHGDLHSKYDITAPSKVDAILQEAASVGLSVPLVGNRISAFAFPPFSPPR
mmetsp:Transcript_8961/g.20527  ORF Transcript_8961/g.20527 Transcript_8961/m.20527 type:complete len:105 (+) Transcript_8961:60-374(+)